MGAVIDIRGPINADTAYVNGELVGRNTTLSLPEVTHVVGTINTALGEHEVPLFGLIESMEATIKKIGVDMGLAKICQLKSQTIEFRWAQQVTKAESGASVVEGCKAFLTCVPKSIPGFDIEPGSNVELDIPLSVSRYQLYVDGKEILLIDKIAGICRINGVDYAESLNALL